MVVGALAGLAAFLVFLAFVVGVVLLIIWYLDYARKRAEEMRRRRLAQAAALGVAYEEHPSENLIAHLDGLQGMPRGHRRYCEHVFRGYYRGVDVRLFDYVYVTRSTDSKGRSHDTYHYMGLAVGNLGERYPQLTIVPETFGHKFWDAIGGDDIDFESEEFSKKFWVKCDDRKFAYDVIHPRMMEHLLAPGWQRWEVHGGVVATWKAGRVDLEEIPHALERLVTFVDLVPSFVRTAKTANPAARPAAARWEGGWWTH